MGLGIGRNTVLAAAAALAVSACEDYEGKAEGFDVDEGRTYYCSQPEKYGQDRQVEPGYQPSYLDSDALLGKRCINDAVFRGQNAPALINARVALAIHIAVLDTVDIEDIMAEIRDSIISLNQVFEPVGIEFFITSIDEIDVAPVEAALNGSVDNSYSLYEKFAVPPQEGAISITYLPRIDKYRGMGEKLGTKIVMYYGHPDWDIGKFEDAIPTANGKVGPNVLAHEVGHNFGLPHPFADWEFGDGLPGSPDYTRICFGSDWMHFDFQEGDFSTYVDDGKCWRECNDGCFTMPFNVMDYHGCHIVAPNHFSAAQIDAMWCFANTEPQLTALFNTYFPEIGL